MPEVVLEAKNIAVRFGHGRLARRVLEDVSVSFAPGSLTVVMGPSGSGKTTLLSVLGCLLRPEAGEVWIGGENVASISESRRATVRQGKIGFVFQAFRLFHALTALDNAAVQGAIRGFGGRAGKRKAQALLETLGLAGKLHLKPDELSGGEKQRVAIARALLEDPPIVLADEPTAALDADAATQVSFILRSLAHIEGRTVVVVSHDERWRNLADQVIRLENGRVVDQKSEAYTCVLEQ